MTAASAPPGGATPASTERPPFFHRHDWIACLITTLITMAGYLWTLAPDVTLEDSGELAVAAHYAGVPHPPGYPVWTLYAWFFTVLLPISNIAWRVAVSSAFAAAVSSGLLALIVSRVSRVLVAQMDPKDLIPANLRTAISAISATSAGLVIGFNGFLWSQAVIVEVYTLSVLSLVLTLLFLLLYAYSPDRRRYLYWGAFLFGIAFTNHQTLIVAAMGIEVFITLVNRRLGRDAFFANTLIYTLSVVLMSHGGLEGIRSSPALKLMFDIVGLGSLITCAVLALRDKRPLETTDHGLALSLVVVALTSVIAIKTQQDLLAPASAVEAEHLTRRYQTVAWLGVIALAAAGGIGLLRGRILTEWKPALISLVMWCVGSSLYFYMPIAGATNPPLNWGYPRTWDGFVHAFTRGQYERTNPTLEVGRFLEQVMMLFEGAVEEFNLAYLLIAAVPFLFWRRIARTEKNWIGGLAAIYFCLAFLLLWLLNPNLDRQSRELTKVFFAASHVIIAMSFGYGLALIAAALATAYEEIRSKLLLGATIAGGLALFVVIATFGGLEFLNPDGVAMPFGVRYSHDLVERIASVVALGMALAAMVLLMRNLTQPPLRAMLVLFALLPAKTMLTHWADNEQRGHLFGYWFGHDMFKPPFKDANGQPLFPEMPREAILFGGTDPGRFNPTYMIFSESFLPPRCKPRDPTFDRRDVYLITQNALADPPYLNYIRAHYNRSQQLQYDTPFFQEMLRSTREKEKGLHTNAIARAVAPLDRLLARFGNAIEKKRRAGTSWFKPEDFVNLTTLSARLRPSDNQDPFSRHLSGLLSDRTRELLTAGNPDRQLARALANDFNRILEKEYQARMRLHRELTSLAGPGTDATNTSPQVVSLKQAYRERPEHLYRPDILRTLELSPSLRRLIQQDVPTPNRIRMGRRILEEAYPGCIAISPGGLYPDLEIHTPTPEEASRAYTQYLQDAYQRRLIGQLKPNEEIREADGRVSFTGQVSVMAINALLCRTIFDANPHHEFFIEESFALEWMYPHLVPYGIIMKLNRQPLASIDEDIVRRDHEFWRQYSTRLIGDWITYDTTVDELCDFVEKVHLRKDLRGFKGDRRFIRDNNAQNAFAKLRSSIGGVYAWRVNGAISTEDQQRMIREAEFAFRQAFAFGPHGPEVVYRYVKLLADLGRVDEAMKIAETSVRLDPLNPATVQLLEQVRRFSDQSQQISAARQLLQSLEERYRQNPSDISNALTLAQAYLDNQYFSQATQIFGRVTLELEPQWQAAPTNPVIGTYLAASYLQLRQPVRAQIILKKVIELPNVDPNTLLVAAQTFAGMNDGANLERTLARLVEVAPENPEAWYDHAAVAASLNRTDVALHSLSNALRLNQERLARDPRNRNLRAVAVGDARFRSLHNRPEWRQWIGAP